MIPPQFDYHAPAAWRRRSRSLASLTTPRSCRADRACCPCSSCVWRRRPTSSISGAFPASTRSARKAASPDRRAGDRDGPGGRRDGGGPLPDPARHGQGDRRPPSYGTAPRSAAMSRTATRPTTTRPPCSRSGPGWSPTGPDGERTIGVDDFFHGLFMTALAAGEILTEIRIPSPGEGSGGAYLKLERRWGITRLRAWPCS